MGRYLEALRQEIAGVRLGTDIEAIHRMRVASRRMRSALPLLPQLVEQRDSPGDAGSGAGSR